MCTGTLATTGISPISLMLAKFGNNVDIRKFVKLGTCLNPIPNKGSLCHETNGRFDGLTR